ncbi:hypothetical protein JTB14_008673 [Gonioctena quinquepunctata]|nr:hypothetical protein JTB14_008673 [Gonioctena quinquepunctata]
MQTKVAPMEVEVKLLEEKSSKFEVKAFKRRWIIIMIYVYYACVASLGWIEYSSITPLVVKYYNVSTLAVDWTAIVYMAVYPFFIIPASYIMDKKGLRTTALIGCIGTFIGMSVKVLSIRRDLFWIVLLGQTIVSISQVFITSLPPKLASVWFKPSEVSTACSLGVLGSTLGTSIGYFLPPMIVHNSDDLEDIGNDLKVLCWILALSMIPVTIAVIFYFPDQPPLPPSVAQANIRNAGKKLNAKIFLVSIGDSFRNRGLMIHMVAYSINIAVFSAIGTLLTQFILQYFEGDNEDAGRMGFVMVMTGTLAIFLFGIIMDKTRKYKEIALYTYLLSTLSIVMLMYSLKYRSKFWTYVSCAIVGVFANGYMPIGFELATELTFPAEETTTAGIIVAVAQIISVIFTVAEGYINLWMGCFWSLANLAGFLLLGTIITALVPNDMRRQKAFRKENEEDEVAKKEAVTQIRSTKRKDAMVLEKGKTATGHIQIGEQTEIR